MAQPQLPPNPVSGSLFGAPDAAPSAPTTLPPNPVGAHIGGNTAAGRGPTAGHTGGGNVFTSAGHWLASKASLAGHDIKGIPGGLYDIGRATVDQALYGEGSPFHHKGDANTPVTDLFGQMGKSAVQTAEHPLRDPFATVTWALPLGHGLGRVGAGTAEGGAALRAGEGVGAAVKAARAPKILTEPRSLTAPGGEPVSLSASKNALRRLYQHAHDTYVQKMIDTRPESVVAKYGASRMHGSLAEISRANVRFRQAVVSNLRKASQPVKGEIVKAAKSAGLKLENDPKTLGQAAIELVSHNTTPEEAILRAEHAIEAGVNPELNAANIGLYKEIQGLDLVHNLGREVGINPAFERTAHAESVLNGGATSLDKEIAGRNLRPADQLEARRNLPAAVTQRLKPFEAEKTTPALRAARSEFERIDRVYQKALDQEAAWRQGNGQKTFEGSRVTTGPNKTPGVPEHSNPYRNRVVNLGIRHEAALERVQKLEARAGITTHTSVPEDLAARQELHRFATQQFGKEAADQRIGLLDARARQFARENDVPTTEFYRRFLKHLKSSPTLSPEAADLLEIQPFHGFAEEKTAKNLRTKTNPRTQKSGMPQNKTMLTKAGLHFAGPILPEQWLARVESVLKTATERDHAARWYEHFEPLFREEFPPEVADKIIRGFSVSQASASPSSGVASTLAALERMQKGEEVGSIGSVVADNIEKALKGEHIDSKVAAKLSDFIDALRGESTRTWMGHAVEGGAPAPIDIWGLRDLGYWDKKILSKGRDARLERLHGVDTKKLTPDNSGSATGARYERAAEMYTRITDHLNAIKYDGRADWTPAQVQALGWSAIQRFYGQTPEDLATAITKGRTRAAGIIQRGHIAKAVEAAKEPDGGFTLNRDFTADTGKDGFAVALAPYEERVPAGEFTTKDLYSYEARHRALLERDPTLRIGGWHNPEDGVVYLDVSRVLPTREEAVAFAREHGQLSVFDRAAAARGDWENAFPSSGLSTAEADAIKSEARARAQAPETYRRIIHTVAEKELGRKPTALDLKYTEDKMHEAAQAKPTDLTSQQFLKLYDDAHAELQARTPQPEELFSQSGGTVRGSYNPESATMSFSQQHAIPETVTHEALHAVRQSLPELLQRKFERRYGVVDGQWTRPQEERFVEDMTGVANGTVHDPELVRNFHQLTEMLPGRSFTPLKTLQGASPTGPMARAQGPVIGLATDPLDRHMTTGSGLLEGRHQADVTDAVARHWHNVFRFFNTQDWRNLIAKTGSDVRRSSRDILVRVDNRTEGGAFQPNAAGKISAEVDQILGRKRDTSFTPQMEGEDAGVVASLQQYVDHLFPGRDPLSEEAHVEANAPEGTAAPKGFKWVDRSTVGELDVPTRATSGAAFHIGRFFDNLNGAVTGATVYFKLGHFGTRYLTNAATNIMQGSAAPLSLKAAVEVWHALTPEERMQALSYAGTHYYEALPGAEGESRVSHIIQHGIGPKHVMAPQWWASYVDSPFRFNSLAYEVRKSAYGPGADAFRSFLGDVRDYNHLDPAKRAEVDGVLRRGNREAIAYDRLNGFEKKYLARAVWFYPWVKGSTVWTGSALLEHPFKSAALAQAGVHGREQQAAEIGDVPSYSYGVFLLSHGRLPLAADWNTFNPMGTAGDVLQIPSHTADLAGMLNPALGAAQQVATSTDQYGAHTNHPLSSALESAVAATPESQIVTAIHGARGDQSHREYPAVPGDPFSKTWLGETLRMLIGPGAPRRFNPEAAHSLAKRERTGR